MRHKKKILFLASINTLVEAPRKNGKCIILICLAYQIFILLSNVCFASSFDGIREKIKKDAVYHIEYNFSKTAAIVNLDSSSATYINFKTKRVKNIVKDWINIGEVWKTNNIAYLQGSCGTGCAQSIIFMAPKTSIICPVHEFRFESLDENYAPDFYNNLPLLIETHKKIYVCYAEKNVIQVFKMPRKLYANIHPPKGYFAESAVIRHGHLLINYSDIKERKKKVFYRKILL